MRLGHLILLGSSIQITITKGPQKTEVLKGGNKICGCMGVSSTQIYSCMKNIDIDVTYILLFIMCKIIYVNDILRCCYCCSSVTYM